MKVIDIDEKEFKKIDLRFRRYSSLLLQSKEEDFEYNVRRFVELIEDCELIKEFIQKYNIIEFNIKNIVNQKARSYEMSVYEINNDKESIISFAYQLLKFIIESEDVHQRDIYMYYMHKKYYVDMLSAFNGHITKKLIDEILIYLEERKIDMDIDGKISITIKGNGQIISAKDNSIVNATINSDVKNDNIEEIFKVFKDQLTAVENMSQDEKDEIIEATEEAINSTQQENPKKTIIKMGITYLQKLGSATGIIVSLMENGDKIMNYLQKFI